jgi:hypothetical protein
MQRVQLEALNPRILTDEEMAHYATLYPASELPFEWVEELVKRFVALLDAPTEAEEE